MGLASGMSGGLACGDVMEDYTVCLGMRWLICRVTFDMGTEKDLTCCMASWLGR